MSNEDDLLKSFLADIDSLSVPSNATKETKEDEIITTTHFIECSDPITKKSNVKVNKETKYEQRYIPPVFAEVDPEEKKKERLDKFFKTETENIKKNKQYKRRENGETWNDPTLADWNENDFRLFVGNLGREVTTEILANQFRQRFPSFTMARVVQNKIGKGSAGYGFVAFSDAIEGIKAMKEMNGKLCGNRPMKIQKSEWQKKNASVVLKKERKEKKTIKAIASARSKYV